MLYYSAGRFLAPGSDTTRQKQRTIKERKKRKRKKEGRFGREESGYMGLGFLERVFYLLLIENSTFYQHYTLFLVFNRLGP